MRRVIGVSALVVVCTYAIVALRGPQGLSALFAKRHEIQVLQEQNADLERAIKMKRERIEKLKSNTGEQELEIRRRLKLQHPNETTFILPEGSKDSK